MSENIKNFLNNLEVGLKPTETIAKPSSIVKITFEGSLRDTSYMACNPETNKWWFRSGAHADWVPSRYLPSDWISEYNKGDGKASAWGQLIDIEELPGKFPDWTRWS